MSEHLDPAQALLLASLAEDEPELSAAREHARGCEACRGLLDEGAELLLQLDLAAPPAPVVAPALKKRVVEKLYGRAWDGSYGLVALLALLSFLLAWKNGVPAGPSEPAPALRCAGFESAYALAPLLIGGALTRMGSVRLPPGRFAALTMSFAVFGQLLLRGHCQAHDLSLHLLVSHFLVVLAAGLCGAGAGRLLASRA
ncbi:MAG: hypothetical protein JWN48_626 [Myxococcaceae bacterium]|nr:hypothetical protein [Myxococcaceae bacterium]